MNRAGYERTTGAQAAHSIDATRKVACFRKIASALTLGMTIMATTAHADYVLFGLDCGIGEGGTCTRGAQLGLLTLSDNPTYPNRVDVDLYISPRAGVTSLHRLYLNYDGPISLAGRAFSLIDRDAPQNAFGPAWHEASLDSAGPAGVGLDVALDLPRDTLTYSGSLVLRELFVDRLEANLDVSMFVNADAGGLIYAAVDTLPLDMSFAAGATMPLWFWDAASSGGSGTGIGFSSGPVTLPYGGSSVGWASVGSPPLSLPAGSGDVPLFGASSILPAPGWTLRGAEPSLIRQNTIPEPCPLALLGIAVVTFGFAVHGTRRSRSVAA